MDVLRRERAEPRGCVSVSVIWRGQRPNRGMGVERPPGGRGSDAAKSEIWHGCGTVSEHEKKAINC